MLRATDPKTLGQILKSVRIEKGLTQHEAGQLVGITQAMVSRIETGESNVRMDTLFRLLAALNMEIHLQPRDSSLFSGQGEEW